MKPEPPRCASCGEPVVPRPGRVLTLCRVCATRRSLQFDWQSRQYEHRREYLRALAARKAA